MNTAQRIWLVTMIGVVLGALLVGMEFTEGQTINTIVLYAMPGIAFILTGADNE